MSRLSLAGLLLLKVLVGTVCGKTAEDNDGVETNAETGARVVGGRGNGTGEGGLGLGVAGVTLQGTDDELLKSLAGLVTVADILESLGGVLAGNIEKNLFTTGMLIHELGDVVDLVVDHAVEILLGVMLGNVLVSELLEGHLD